MTGVRIRVAAQALATKRGQRYEGFAAARRVWQSVRATDPLRVGLFATTFALIGTMLFQRPVAVVGVGDAELLVRPWDLAWGSFLAFALPLIVRHLRAEGIRALRPPTSAALVFALYAAAAALSLIAFVYEFGTAGFPEATIRAIRFAFVAFAAIVLAWELRPRVQTALIVAVIGVSLVAGVEALYAYFFDVKREIIGNRVVEYDVTRPGGPFGNYHSDGLPDRWWASSGASTTLGFWLGVAIALTGAALLRRLSTGSRPIVRMVPLLSIPPLIGALVVTGSREAWIGGFVVFLFLLILYWRVRKIPVLTLALCTVGAVGVATAVSPGVSGRVLNTFTPGTFEFRTGPEARFHAWQEGLGIAWDRFPIGWGVGAIEEHAQLFGTPTSENLYIQSLVQMGVIGAVLVVAFVVCGLRGPISDLRRNSDDLWSVLRFSVVAVAAVHGVFGYTLADPTVQTLVALALVPSTSRQGPKDEPESRDDIVADRDPPSSPLGVKREGSLRPRSQSDASG